jgi:hypothetical protein
MVNVHCGPKAVQPNTHLPPWLSWDVRHLLTVMLHTHRPTSFRGDNPYKQRKKATRSSFSWAVKWSC